MNHLTLSRSALGGVAALAGFVVAAVAGLPGPTWMWLVLSGLYVIVALRTAGSPGPGWLIAVTMAATLDPFGAAVVVGVMGLVLGLPLAARHGSRLVAGVAGDVLPVVGFGAVLSIAAPDSVLGVAVAGAVAGAVARSAAAGFKWLAVARATYPGARMSLFAEVAEAAGLGSGAALLGHMLAEVGTLTMPAVVAGVLILVAAEASRREVVHARVAAVRSLLTALEAKDLYTRGHSERVAGYARLAGKHMGLSSEQVDRLELASLLHDVGKVVTPRHLLRKKGPLTGAEYCRIQHHADVVPEILDGMRFLEPVVPIISEHHVHFDGNGYGQLHGELSVEARILAVADSFDAMTTHRPYRAALSREYAFAELRRCGGSQFDPVVVESFIDAMWAANVVPAGAGIDSDEEARRIAEGARADVR